MSLEHSRCTHVQPGTRRDTVLPVSLTTLVLVVADLSCLLSCIPHNPMHGMVVYDDAFREELEALQSVYFDMRLDQGEEGSIRIFHSFVPRDTRASFVIAEIEITIPTSYPAKLPCLHVLKSSGISDNGVRSLLEKVRAMQETLLGEPHLFQLVDTIYEILELSTAGDCLFCAEPLERLDTASSCEGLIGVRTPCFHSFHLQCLAKWAAISLKKLEDSKDERALQERETSLVKGLEGQLKSIDGEFSQIRDQIRKLECELAGLPLSAETSSSTSISTLSDATSASKSAVKTATMPSSNSLGKAEAPLKRVATNRGGGASSGTMTIFNLPAASSSPPPPSSIADLRTQLSKVVESIRAATTNDERKMLTGKSRILRERIAVLERAEIVAEDKQKEQEENGDISPRVIRDNLENSLYVAKDKLLRLEKRRSAVVQELEEAKKKVEGRRQLSQQTDLRKFPCPACRSELHQHQLVLEDHKMFARVLDAAIEAERTSS